MLADPNEHLYVDIVWVKELYHKSHGCTQGELHSAHGVPAAARLQGEPVVTLPQGVQENTGSLPRAPSPPEPKATPPEAMR